MKIGVIGGFGQLGSCLSAIFKNQNHELVSLSSNTIDITKKDQVQMLADYNFDLFINASAYTLVDKAEEEKEKAFAINEKGVLFLVEIAKKLDIPLVHISTDYVFDGNFLDDYTEQDKSCPLNVYGASKLAGELQVQDNYDKHIILRVSWLFSEYGSNFLTTMFSLKDREELSIVSDQYGKPTYAIDLAKILLSIVTKIEKEGNKFFDWGLYHYGGDNTISWYDFSESIFKVAKDMNIISKLPLLKKIKTADYPTKARRPLYSSLSTEKIERVFSVCPSVWVKGIESSLSALQDIMKLR